MDTLHYQVQGEQGQKQNEGGESFFHSWFPLFSPIGEIETELTTRAMALKALDARLASSPTPTPAPASVPGPSTSPTTATAPIPPTLNKAASSKAVPQVEDKVEKVKD